MNNFKGYNRAVPCPLCGGATDCRRNLLNGLIFCRRTSELDEPTGYRFCGTDKIGFRMFAEDGVDRKPYTHAANTQRISTTEPKPKPIMVGGNSALERYFGDDYSCPASPERIARLSANLGLPIWAFSILPIRFVDCDETSRLNMRAFLFEERDGTGKVVGCHLRYPIPLDGPGGKDNKRTHGERGLFIPSAWDATGSTDASTLYLCEGVTDLLALTAMGLAAIGRSNNAAGAEHLTQLLRAVPPSRPIVVLADNDQAGRDGATGLADQLAAALSRPILVMTTSAKDSRASFHAACGELAGGLADAATVSREFAASVGERFAAACAATVRVYLPAMDNATQTAVVNIAVDIATLNFTAADCVPHPDDLPPLPSPTVCPHRKIIHQERGQWCREVLADCKEWTCYACGPRRKQQHADTATKHIGLYGGDMYEFACKRAYWPSVSRQMQQRHETHPLPDGALISDDCKTATWIDEFGQVRTAELSSGYTVYRLFDGTPVSKGTVDADPDTTYRIKGRVMQYGISYAAVVQADGDLHVFSTEEPPSSKVSAIRVENSEAIRRVSFAVEMRSCPEKGQRLLLTSHDWPLIPDRESGKPTGWKTVKNAVRLCTEETIRDILKQHDIKPEESTRRWRYFGATFLTWKNDGSGKKECIMQDFAAGWFGANAIGCNSASADAPKFGIEYYMESCFPSSA